MKYNNININDVLVLISNYQVANTLYNEYILLPNIDNNIVECYIDQMIHAHNELMNFNKSSV